MKFPSLSWEKTFLIIWVSGSFANLLWAGSVINDPSLYLGISILGTIFWAWFTRFILRTSMEFRQYDNDEKVVVKAKARLEPLESPGPEYLGEEAA